MAAGERRRATRAPARLTVIVLANLAAAFCLWQVLAAAPEDDPSSGPSSGAATEFAQRSAGPHAAAPGAGLARREREVLLGDLRAIVGRWKEKARELTKGRVGPRDVHVAVHLREAGARDGLGLEENRPMRPASNMKLMTTAAALVLLGAEGEFDTRFEARGPLVSGRLAGDLVVRAAGDPLYDPTAAGRVEQLIAPAIEQLKEAGLRSIEGDLVLDEGSFPVPAPGPAWPDASQHWTEYCALAGGFSANRGCLTATVEAREAGSSARVLLRPRGHGLPERIEVDTARRGSALTIAIQAREGGALVRGRIPAGAASWTDSMAHPDPVALFGSVLRHELERGGVTLRGRVRRERNVAPGDSLRVLAHLRTRIVDTLAPINRDSTNAVADQLFFATGHLAAGSATREGAARATSLALERLGVPADGLVQVDGSGLSRDNRVTARQVTALLDAVLALDPATAGLYLESLAVAGESGTLEDRMQSDLVRGKVRGKTGFIAGTSALSGVAGGPGGERLVFSILVDYPNTSGLNRTCWKPMQDEICARLVEALP